MPRVIGVVGAGTMGAGIAQLACLQAGARTLLHDPMPEALARGVAGIEHQLERGVERERWSAEDAAAARERLEAAERLEDLAACDLVIEAAPESLALKHELYERLSARGRARMRARHEHLLAAGDRDRRRRDAIPSAWSACTSSTPRR